jgi:hypothetical protein
MKYAITGISGEYFVCAELAQRGILAVVAPKNNPEIDVLATMPDGSRSVNIQVKAMSLGNKQGWKLNKGIERKIGVDNFYVVLVRLLEPGMLPDFYIFERDEFADLVKACYEKYRAIPTKKGTPRAELNFRWFDFKDFGPELAACKNRWDLLGFDLI